MNQDAKDLIYLIYCGLNSIVPDKSRIDDIDLDAIIKLASKHMVYGTVATALKNASIDNLCILNKIAQTQRKEIILNNDIDQIVASFETYGIWYMLLKGAVIKNLYPHLGMREMADVDILIDENRADDVRNILNNQGFKIKSFGNNNVDSYIKSPLTHIEIHRTLFGFQHDRLYYDYFRNIKDRLIKDNDNSFGYHFSNEDFYIYYLVHEYKHYSIKGTGLRSLMDTYLILKNYNIDFNYVNREIALLGLVEFESKIRELSTLIFESGEYANNDILEYIVNSGAFGNLDNLVNNRINRSKGGKLKYLIRRLFGITDGNYWEYLNQRHPVFYRYKVLLPFLPLYRLIYGIYKYPKRLKEEFKSVMRK